MTKSKKIHFVLCVTLASLSRFFLLGVIQMYSIITTRNQIIEIVAKDYLLHQQQNILLRVIFFLKHQHSQKFPKFWGHLLGIWKKQLT